MFALNFVLEVLIAIVASVGNGMVIAVIVRNHQLHTITNYLIVSLATADFLVGVLGIPCVLVTSFGLPRNFYGCLLVNCAIMILCHVSIFCLLVVAIERFLAIKYPFFYHTNFTPRVALTLIALEWILGGIVGLIPLGWNLGPPPGLICYFNLVIDMKYHVYFGFIGFIFTPLLIMLCIYFYIFKVIRSQIRQIASLEISRDPSSYPTKMSVKKEIKAAKRFCLVIGMFALCWFPLELTNFVSVVSSKECLECVYIGVWLSHANSAINPILYAYGNSGIKRTLKATLLCRRVDAGTFALTSITHYNA